MIIKICGITTVDDGRDALAAGADWIGLNFVAGPRRIELERATEILSALDEPSRAVCLLRIEDGGLPADHLELLRRLGVQRAQIYGHLTPQIIEILHELQLQAIAVRHWEGDDTLNHLDTFLDECAAHRPDFVLFDTSIGDKLGGTGQPLDWKTLQRARSEGRFEKWPPVVLAGGLNRANVAGAIQQVQPFGVDVSSGVESAPGRKDRSIMQAFVAQVRGT